jgi:tRNA G18 (ribose-2'-O)-methylase SpoU
MIYQFYECQNRACRFRFPAAAHELAGNGCPTCGGPLTAVAVPPGSERDDNGQPAAVTPAAPPPLEIMLDNIRSLYNVGAILRTADGARVNHVHLCGITAVPTQPRLAKTALGAEAALPWTYYRNGVAAASQLKARGCRLWALEAAAAAIPLFACTPPTDERPLLLIVGNEKTGIDPGILALCERIVSLPMGGIKESLNVAAAFGIAVYYVRYGVEKGDRDSVWIK